MDSLLLLATLACAQRDEQLRKGKLGERPTLPQCYVQYHREILGTTSFAPKCKNKGAVGLELERLWYSPSSTASTVLPALMVFPVKSRAFPKLASSPHTTASIRVGHR